MAQDARIAVAVELEDVLQADGDPELDAVRVAIYLEDALGVVLPAEFLDWEHLGSVEAITTQRTVRPSAVRWVLPGLVEES